jgi:repressor LexA
MFELTLSQKKLLETIKRLKDAMGMSPTVKELACELSLQAPSIHEALKRLEEKGCIRRTKRKARSIEVIYEQKISKTQLVAVNVIGTVAAGFPILAEENLIAEIMIPDNILRGKCFALKIQGDSMVGAGIFENDYVVVRQQPIAENNDIIVAMIDGDATVKRLYISEDRIELRPENKKLFPIVIEPEDDLKIIGKVIHVCSKSIPKSKV